MHWLASLSRRFSTGPALSADSARGALKEFYRAIHPDLFEKAPSKVKEENERSLKQLNNYMDCLKRNQGATSVLLKFYAASKENLKSKKFLFFQVELPAFLAHSSEDARRLHELNALKRLRTALYSVRVANNPFAKHAKEAAEDAPDRNVEDQYPSAFFKSSSRMSHANELFKMRDELMQTDAKMADEEVLGEIQRTLKLHYPNLPLPERVAEEVQEELESQKALRSLQKAQIDARMFYVDRGAPPGLINDFLVALAAKVEQDPLFRSQMWVVQSYCISKGPKLKVMLSERFGVIPGMVVVHCAKSPVEALNFASEHFDEALALREQMFEDEKVTRKIGDLAEELKQDFGLGKVDVAGVTVDATAEDDAHKKSLFLKKLAHVCSELSRKKRSQWLAGVSVELSPKGVQIDRESKVWRLCWNFDEERLFKKLSRELPSRAPSPAASSP